MILNKFKQNIAVFVCLVIIGDARYLNDDIDSDFLDNNFKDVTNRNSKREVEVWITQGAQDKPKVQINEENIKISEISSNSSNARTDVDVTKGKSEDDDGLIRRRPKKKINHHQMFAESEIGYEVKKSTYRSNLVPDYILYNIRDGGSATESTTSNKGSVKTSVTETTTSKSLVKASSEEVVETEDKETNIDIPNPQIMELTLKDVN